MSLLLLTVPVFSPLLGGMMALRLRRFLGTLMALGAGLLLGAAFLDLLSEAIKLGSAARLTSANVLGLTLLSFLLFHSLGTGLDVLGRQLLQWRVGGNLARRTGALMLIFHSFRDGVAIGAAYSAFHSAGYAVAFGIAAHDIGDGMNTVILTTGGEKPRLTDYFFLAADAIAPFLGGLLTAWWVMSARGSVILFVLAAGFFLQLATADFLPEVRKTEDSQRFLLLAVALGSLSIYVANLFIKPTSKPML